MIQPAFTVQGGREMALGKPDPLMAAQGPNCPQIQINTTPAIPGNTAL